MNKGLLAALLFVSFSCSCSKEECAEPDALGRFQPDKDLFLAHFDVKTDVDDVHSVAGVATMLADSRFSDVSDHAVAGTYGTQEGLYVPATEVFDLAFGERWSDAHTDRSRALAEVGDLAIATLSSGGTIWIADAGQSDFSAALIRSIRQQRPETGLKHRIHIVQHADWNEKVTTPQDLTFVKETASYHRIADGYVVGNGTPGFRSDAAVDWREHIRDARLIEIWETAISIANAYNSVDGRYLNESIKKGGLDFSDVAESAWIFGFGDLRDASDLFFQGFSHPKSR